MIILLVYIVALLNQPVQEPLCTVWLCIGTYSFTQPPAPLRRAIAQMATLVEAQQTWRDSGK